MDKPPLRAVIALLAAGLGALVAAKARTHRRALALTRAPDAGDTQDVDE